MTPAKQPIGHYEHRKSFTRVEIPLQKNDNIYFFTDGFADQFGGPNGKKFKYSGLKELFISVCQKLLHEQKTLIEQAINEWRGKNEQVDDICIFGVNI